VRKLCRKRSRSLKSWFEGREEPVQESYILLPNSKTNLESEDKIGKSFFLLITRNIFQVWKKVIFWFFTLCGVPKAELNELF